jgi:glucosamine kinase
MRRDGRKQPLDLGMDFFAGVDGGGTRCRLRLRRADGTLLGEGFGGRANLYASVEESFASIMQAAGEALADAGLGADDYPRIGCGLGLAGAHVGDAAQRLRGLLPFGAVRIETDGAAALAGAFRGGDGAIAILGTGSMYIAQQAGKIKEIGGWGFHLGDQGSGADLGRRALERVLLAHDNVVEASPMTEALLAEFGRDPLKIVAFARDATPADYGRFAPLVFDSAEAGDPAALAVIAPALGIIAASLRQIGSGQLCLLGGLGKRYRPLIEAEFGKRLAEPMADAMDGAILLAGGKI